jgi:Tfp pilus assembly protein PilF
MKKNCLRTACLVVFAIAVVSGIGWQSRSKHWRGSKSTNGLSAANSLNSSMTSQLSNSAKIKALLSLLKKDPSSALICNRLAYLYYSEKKYTSAEYYYKKAITYNSRNIEARLGLYLVNMVKKNYVRYIEIKK